MPKVLGWYLNAKTREQKSIKAAIDLLRKDLDVIFIDIFQELPPPNQFDAIFHKPTLEWNSEDSTIQEKAHHFVSFLRDNPSIIQIDPVDSVLMFTNRLCIDEKLSSFSITFNDSDNIWTVQSPCSLHLLGSLEMALADLQEMHPPLPCYVKPSKSCGPRETHQLSICSTLEQLLACLHSHPTQEFLVQECISHLPIVHKAYTVLGECIFSRKAGSVPHPTSDTQYDFDSQKKFSIDGAVEQEESSLNPIPQALFAEIASAISRLTGVQLFGFDVIRKSDDPHRLYVIDINYLPSFSGMDEAPEAIRRNILKRMGIEISS
ncbi:putative Inositol 1, 3, 4-trisphosphate 5/6-kinase [Blattamonas nauphoetae]|uniref:Inositol-tetrakisphosphate 1-kinase n=1 Tax=Blattamonas nauphoetae TaxID=2049346 RepID=A0ABQ9XWG6_9EUKA|nr:putative Inositol 1, 3, 4-trisphosphate 5/6-kinase [Blattamonas nauphoetae]